MHEYEIRGFTRKCAATGEPIPPGSMFYTVIRPGMPEYVREDYSLSAWKGPPEDAIAWWRSIATETGQRKPRVPSEIILEYFEQLEQDPTRDEERFLLALLMVRRRILRIEGDVRDEEGREAMELYCHRNEKTYRVRVAVPTTKALEKEIEDRLLRLLDQAQVPTTGAAPTASPNIPLPPAATLLLLILCLITSTGCLPTWLRRTPTTPPPPVVYDRMPTMQEIVQFTNDHSLRVRQLQAEGATISYKAPPLSVAIPLRAKLSFDLPRRVRLTADLGMGGDLVDVGSNDEFFWFWAKPADPSSIFYARYDDYPRSAIGRRIPFDPSWIADALGLVYLDPNSRLDGPFPANQAGRFDVRTWIDTPAGNLQRVITFDQRFGYVHSQYLYDPYGQPLAQIHAKQHRYDSTANVTLAHELAIHLPQIEANILFNARSYLLNSIGYDNNGRLWEPPQLPDARMVDIAAPNFDPARYFGPPSLAMQPTKSTTTSPIFPISRPVSQETAPRSSWQGPRQLYLGSGTTTQLR